MLIPMQSQMRCDLGEPAQKAPECLQPCPPVANPATGRCFHGCDLEKLGGAVLKASDSVVLLSGSREGFDDGCCLLHRADGERCSNRLAPQDPRADRLEDHSGGEAGLPMLSIVTWQDLRDAEVHDARTFGGWHPQRRPHDWSGQLWGLER